MFYPSTSDIISISAKRSDKPRLSFKITVQLVPYLGDKNSDTRHTDSGDSGAENVSRLAAAQQLSLKTMTVSAIRLRDYRGRKLEQKRFGKRVPLEWEPTLYDI